jgi:hypothetical protein
MNENELNEFIRKMIEGQNQAPVQDFLGINPDQMYGLVYHPFTEQSVLKFKKNISEETLSKIPFLLLTEHFLRILAREKTIKLTAAQGHLPLKIVAELYEPKYIAEVLMENGLYKQAKEEYLYSIQALRINTPLAGLAKKVNGKMSLTKKGETFLKTPAKRQELFQEIFKAFCTKYNWGYTDGYNFESMGQGGFAFSLLMMQNFGNEAHPKSFYGEKYLKAFPMDLENPRRAITQSGWYFGGELTPEQIRKQGISCYIHRTFQYFMNWFGLIEMTSEKDFMKRDEATVKKTEVLDLVLEGVALRG